MDRQILIELLQEWANVQRLYAKAKVNTDFAIMYDAAKTGHALQMLRLCKRYGVEVGE
jgi:anion-transporting  ArsA/GET3 family ATPase